MTNQLKDAVGATHDGPPSPGLGARAEERTFLIGDLAKEFSVTLRTLRFYEDRGLLKPRRRGVARLYTVGDRERLLVILKGKQLGFTLGEIAVMLESGNTGQAADLKLSVAQVEDQISHLQRQKADIEAAIDELMRTRTRLVAA
jgi:DNA-binding transcriptional MerR regulator